MQNKISCDFRNEGAKKHRRKYVYLFRLIIALVFLFAAVPKMINPQEFAVSVFYYQLAPYNFVNVIAVLLPWIEMVMAVTLVLPGIDVRWQAGAEGVLLVLLAGFTVAISINVYRGVDIACGCFSVNPDVGKIGWLSIGRNTGLIFITLGLLVRDIYVTILRKYANIMEKTT